MLELLLYSSIIAADTQGACMAPSFQGCFTDPYKNPHPAHVPYLNVLNQKVSGDDPNMTPDNCVALCCSAGYDVGSLSGVENGTDCYCDDGLGPCPVGDSCCSGHLPDAYKVPGGFGCAPPGPKIGDACAEGGRMANGLCCCGPGPTTISATKKN
eukprot:gene18466-12268_t